MPLPPFRAERLGEDHAPVSARAGVREARPGRARAVRLPPGRGRGVAAAPPAERRGPGRRAPHLHEVPHLGPRAVQTDERHAHPAGGRAAQPHRDRRPVRLLPRRRRRAARARAPSAPRARGVPRRRAPRLGGRARPPRARDARRTRRRRGERVRQPDPRRSAGGAVRGCADFVLRRRRLPRRRREAHLRRHPRLDAVPRARRRRRRRRREERVPVAGVGRERAGHGGAAARVSAEEVVQVRGAGSGDVRARGGRLARRRPLHPRSHTGRRELRARAQSWLQNLWHRPSPRATRPAP